MCYLIYGALILTFTVYSDALIGQYALSVASGDDQWIVIALGWELIWALWPVLILVAVVASALTWFAARLK